MRDPAALSQAELEILVARELRRAGLTLPVFTVRRRTQLAAEEGRYVLVLDAVVCYETRQERVLIHCHNRFAPVTDAHVQALVDHAREAKRDGGILVSTSGFDQTALVIAMRLGIPLLAVADGATAWRGSGWASSQRPPAWFPEFTAQLIEPGATGQPRARLLAADQPRVILDQLRPLGCD